MKSRHFSQWLAVSAFAALWIMWAPAQSGPVVHSKPASVIEGFTVPTERQEPQGASRGATAQSGFGPLIFLPVVTFGSVFLPTAVAVADLNGDGKPDVVAANECMAGGGNCDNGGVTVLLGNGDGTFQPAVSYNSGGYQAYSVAIGDVNHDGYPDLVVTDSLLCASCSNGGVSVFLGNGDGTFQPPVIYNSGGSAHSVVIADLNGDGRLDLAIGNCVGEFGGCSGNAFGLVPGSVSVLLGNGDGTFQPAITYSSGGLEATSLVVGDVNRDGKPDLIVGNYCAAVCSSGGAVGVLLGKGDGKFEAAVSYTSGTSSADSIALGDFNGDGKLDLAVAGFTVSVLLGNGNGTFKAPVNYSSGSYDALSVALSHVNGDSKLDLLVGYGCDTFSCNNGSAVNVFLGNGDGTFQTPVPYPSGYQYANGLAAADVNRDGQPDLLVESPGGLALLLNNRGAPPTSTSLISSRNPTEPAHTATYTATVSSESQDPINGTVFFTDGAANVATVPLANNQASFTAAYTNKQAGAHTIVATYGGELHVVTGSQSAALTEYVRIVTSKTVLTTSESPSLVGQQVTFTAKVSATKGVIPDGELITFTAGNTVLGTGKTTNGTASLTTTFSQAKTYTVKASYPGDNVNKMSAGTVKQVVNP